MRLLLHQVEQNRYDSEKARKDEDIESNLSILFNYRFSKQIPPTPLFSNACHVSMHGARVLRLDLIYSSFRGFSESYLFCSTWCNRSLVLTCTYNPVQLQIFLIQIFFIDSFIDSFIDILDMEQSFMTSQRTDCMRQSCISNY